MSVKTPPKTDPPIPSAVLAQRLAESLGGCDGVHGLDPESELSTLGAPDSLRGLRLSRSEDGVADVAADLIGFDDARLPVAGQAVREALAGEVAAAGGRLGALEVRFTGLIPRISPPAQRAVATEATAEDSPAAGAVEAFGKPSGSEHAVKVDGGPIVMPVQGGRTTALVITVELVSEQTP